MSAIVWRHFSISYLTEAMATAQKTIRFKRWPPYWPTGRLADNQKMRNLADNLSKMSNKTYCEAVIGQFKTLFRKRINIPQFFHQLM